MHRNNHDREGQKGTGGRPVQMEQEDIVQRQAEEKERGEKPVQQDGCGSDRQIRTGLVKGTRSVRQGAPLPPHKSYYLITAGLEMSMKSAL